MQKVPPLPDYREIEIPISIASLKDYIEPMLYHLGYVKDDEEIIGIDGNSWQTLDLSDLWITVKLKKQQQVEVLNY